MTTESKTNEQLTDAEAAHRYRLHQAAEMLRKLASTNPKRWEVVSTGLARDDIGLRDRRTECAPDNAPSVGG
jgi:hypothetical protein